MAEYTPNLDLFRPGTDDNMGIESTLNDNFVKIDEKLGDSLEDAQGKKYTTLGGRLDESKTALDDAVKDVTTLKNKGVNALLNNHFFHPVSMRGVPTCPDNVLVGYRYAVEQGYWGLLGDVQLTSDKIWMMFGDINLEAKTNGTGTFTSKTRAQIKALDCGSKFNANYWAGEQIPDLEDFLLLCRTTQTVPFLNIVGEYVDLDIKSLVDLIKKWDLINDSVITSNNIANLSRVRLYDKTLAVALYMSSHSEETLEDLKELGNSCALYLDSIVTKENMEDLHEMGLPVVAWMNTDNNQRMREILPLGIRGAITKKAPVIRGV